MSLNPDHEIDFVDPEEIEKAPAPYDPNDYEAIQRQWEDPDPFGIGLVYETDDGPC